MTFAWIGSRLRLLVRDESGIALPTALFATIASLSLGGAAVMSSVNVQQGSSRDNGSKSAIGAADAGANVAMQRINRYGDSLSEESPCLNVNASGELEAGDAPVGEPDWCEEVSGEVGGAEYSYKVSALGSNRCVGALCVVSTGSDGDVNRRVELSLDETCPLCTSGSEEKKVEEELLRADLEGDTKKVEELEIIKEELEDEQNSGGGIAGLVGRERISISGNATIKAGVATNGWLQTSGNISICGDVQTGVGKPWVPGTNQLCKGHTNTQGTIELPSVASFMPADIATNNSNGRLTKCNKGLPVDCQKDTYNGNWNGTIPFRPSSSGTTTAGDINLNGNGVLTVGGGDYWLCSLTINGNQEIIMADGAHTRFFFDTPEHCGNPSQINISGNSKITATGYKGKPGEFDMPGFYLLGSTSWVSQANISGNASGNEFVLYGPDTYVNISGNAGKGMIVGREVNISGNVKLEQDDGFEAPPELNPGGNVDEEIEIIIKEIEEHTGSYTEKKEKLEQLENETGSSSSAFRATSYVECSGGAASPGSSPNAGC